jgi:antirestriction protein
MTNIKVPKSYKKYYKENKEKFKTSISFEVSDEDGEKIKELIKNNKVSKNLFLNYFILKSVVEKMIEDQTEYSFGMLYFDFELYTEDEIIELIEKHQRIIIFDEKLEKKSVLISLQVYEEYQKYINISL